MFDDSTTCATSVQPPGLPDLDARAFRSYRSRASEVAREIFAAHPRHALDEQAGPAYLEGLALSRWAFWRRLSAVLRLLPKSQGGVCLDFGCGFGLLLPLLKRRFSKVYGVDLMPDLARQFLKRWGAASGEMHEDVVIANDIQGTGLAEGSVDLILAMDVLEHVDCLEETLEGLHRFLRPGGTIVVSGPTENWIYKLGRRTVGFSGEYHHRTIYDIQRVLAGKFSVRSVRRLLFPFTLFVLIVAVREPENESRG